MIVTGPWQLGDITDHNVSYGVQVMPRFGGSHETISGPDVYMVFNHSDERRRAATDVPGVAARAGAGSAVGHRQRQPAAEREVRGAAGVQGVRREVPGRRPVRQEPRQRASHPPAGAAVHGRSRWPSARPSRPRCSAAGVRRTRSARRPRPPTKPCAEPWRSVARGRPRPPAWRRALPREPDRLVVRAARRRCSSSGSGSSRSSGRSCSRPRPTSGFGPEHSVGLANYRELAHDPEWLAPVGRSLKFTLLYVPTTVLSGLGLALLLNQKIRFIGFYRTCFFVPFVASAAATGVIFLYVLDPQYGIVNNGLALDGPQPPAVPRRPRLGALPARCPSTPGRRSASTC